MPAAAIVAPLALEAVGSAAGVSLAAGSIGAALGASETAIGGILGATSVADVVGGAVIGAGVGAASSAVQGGDIGQGFLVGAITGGVGSAVSGAIGTALNEPVVGAYGPELKATLADSTTLGAAAQRGLTGAITGGLGAGLTGGDIGRGALVGGLGGGLTGALSEGLGLSGTESKLLGGGINYALSQAFAPGTKSSTYIAPSATAASAQPTISGQTSTQATSTAPLGGALLASPTLGYTPGSSFLGGTDSQKPAQNVWNQASLKEGAQVGPGSDGSQAQSS
jgi:hypothetical protein